MDPASLRVFLAVARRLNFTRAAEDVHLSQPAVSRRIAQLETELGVKLFEQIGKSVRLTDAGGVLAREGARLFGDLERLRESVRAFRSPDRGTLRIGASTTPGFYLVPKVLGPFSCQHPDVELTYRVENSDKVIHKLIRNEIDLGFVGWHCTSAELEVVLRFADEIVCFTAASSPLVARRGLRPRALASQMFVLREPGSATRSLVERWFSRQKLRPPRTIELGCPEAVKAVVAGGLGVSFMSRLGLSAEIGTGSLRELALQGLPLRRELVVVRHVDKVTSPAMTAFLDLLGALLAGDARSAAHRTWPAR